MSGSSTQTTNQSETRNPWSVQTPYLEQAFQQAQTNLGRANGNTYTGDQVAQFTPDQLATFQRMIGYGGSSTAPQQSAAAGGALASAGAGAAASGLNNLNNFGVSGGVDSNIDAARKYADGVDISGAVDATMRDANRAVSEQVLPQVARNSALSGNAASSKRAISEGIVQRGLAEKTADVSANLRNDAYKTGLSLAENGRQFDNNAMLDAFKSSAGLGTGAATAGIGGLTSSVGQAGGLFDIANQGGAGMRDADQAVIDNNKGKSEYAAGSAAQNLQDFWNIIGADNWGGTSTGTSTQRSTPSIWSVMGGLMSAGGSLMRGGR